MDLLCEQVKMLAGEVALCTSSLKRLSEQATSNPGDSQMMEQMQKLKDEIREKKRQIRVLEQRMIGSVETTTHASNSIEVSQALSKLASQLNEKTFELEIKSADNRILQEQLQMKVSENDEMQETILLLRRQLNSLSDRSSGNSQQVSEAGAKPVRTCPEGFLEKNFEEGKGISSYEENYADENTPTSVMSLNRIFNLEDSKESNNDLKNQVHMQAAEIENLKQEKVRLIEEKDGLEIQSQKLAEEASYAKELAGAAAIELRNLAEEVTKLSYDNAKLTGDLAATREAHCRSICCQRSVSYDLKHARPDGRPRKPDNGVLVEELQKELNARYQREAVLETSLSEKDQIEVELRTRLDEAKQREEDLENELANMWVLVAKLRMSGINADDFSSEGLHALNISQTRVRNEYLQSNGLSNKMFEEDEVYENMDKMSTLEESRASYLKERRRCKELESLVSRLKGEDVAGLDVTALEELQNLHVEAITKICHAKVIALFSFFLISLFEFTNLPLRGLP
ncbi:kinesin-like protein KIN-7E, chloroplastic [Quercus suber]|uniref:kinesin-like protein KIN-7E, chloroplastic n=1 Tax=Quercus suber TaxID=58331 RepID=UPI0032DF999F